ELGNDKSLSHDWMAFALSSDGKLVAGCGSDVFVWELTTGRLIRRFHFNDRYEEVAFSPNGTKIAAIKKLRQRGNDEQVRIFVGEVTTGRYAAGWLIKEGKPLSFSFDGLAFSADGKFLAGLFSELREEKPFVYSAVSSQVWLLDAATG